MEANSVAEAAAILNQELEEKEKKVTELARQGTCMAFNFCDHGLIVTTALQQHCARLIDLLYLGEIDMNSFSLF